jgi:outer membrane lipoprotein-sorting protein
VAIACSVIAVACRPTVLRPVLPETLPSVERLLQALRERRATESVRGFARIAYESGEQSIGSRHAILASRPDRFRLEILSPPFGTVAVVTSNGRELAVYARRENRIYRGPASAGSVGAYAAVPIAVEDVVTILLGSPPEREPRGQATVSRDDQRALIRLTIPITRGRQDIWFAPDSLLPLASETPLDDGRSLHVTFGDYRETDTIPFPYSVDMRAVPGDRAVRVRYSSPALNSKLDQGLFELPTPPGAEELMIEAYPTGGVAS